MTQPSFNAPAIEALGRMLPGYDFECLIAKGGMGAVYKAKQRSLARDVAIKVLPPEVGHDPQFRKSFETEAHAMARLNHPNLIGVYDSGEVDDMLYIVMEYVPGKSLYHSSYGKMVDPVQAVELIRGICAGLGHAHENGIIHRDIKPANVLLTPKAEPKIGDFGLARLVDSEGSGLVMGTPGYTAPEVISNPNGADHRSDLFSVGVILYELMTGQRQTAAAAPPSTICGCGPAIDDIWRRATHPNPANRFQTANDFRKVLAEWLATRDAAAKRKGGMSGPAPQGKAAAAGVAATPQPAAKQKPQANVASQVQPRRQTSGILVFLQILFFAALLGGTFWAWSYKINQDKRNEQMLKKNEEILDEYKNIQAGGHRGGRPQGAGSARPPDTVAVPNKNPAPPPPRRPETTSKNPAGGPTPPRGNPVDASALETLDARAKELIVAADRKRADQLAANVRALGMDLDVWLRDLPRNEQSNMQISAAKLKLSVRNSRVPEVIPKASGLAVTPQLARIVANRAAKQDQIDTAFLAEMDKLRLFYVSNVKKAMADAEQAGQQETAALFRSALSQAADNQAWVRSFGIDPKPPAPTLPKKESAVGGGKRGGP